MNNRTVLAFTLLLLVQSMSAPSMCSLNNMKAI